MQLRGYTKSHRYHHSRYEPPGRFEPQEDHSPRCHEQQKGQDSTVGGGVIHQVISNKPKPNPALALLSGRPSPMPTWSPTRLIKFTTSLEESIPAS